MERFIQQIKDRTECFDDHFPCKMGKCNRQLVEDVPIVPAYGDRQSNIYRLHNKK